MKHIFDQPRGFAVFFMTEMWERYGFYIIQTLLILYLIHHFNLSDNFSYAVLGSFTALAYVNPILGGYIADKLLGSSRSILWGALLISAGYFILIFLQHLSGVLAALGVIAIGTGLLKPNISSLLGTLYETHDTRRHAGYTLFYVGINLGILIATSLGGYLQYYLGWPKTFLIAALVLIMAWGIFYAGSHYYKLKDVTRMPHNLKNYSLALALIFVAIVTNTLVVTHQTLALYLFAVIALVSFLLVVIIALRSQGQERHKLFAYLLLLIISIFFWAFYFQMFLSMNLFANRVVDRHLLGLEVPASLFVAVEALSLIALGPLFSYLWHNLERRHISPSTPLKFALGLLMLTVAYALLWVSTSHINSMGLILGRWVALAYFIIAIGELLLSPTGLAMTTELVPSRYSGLMMGIFFVSLGLGGKLAGLFADYSSVAMGLNNLQDIEAIYRHAFNIYLYIAIGATIISFCMVPVIKRLMGDEL